MQRRWCDGERSRKVRLRSKGSISEHPFKDFPLDRLGTHSLKRSSVVLMKDQCTSTALVGAIAGTTAKTLDRIYDAPTWQRQQAPAVKVVTPVATALLQAAPDPGGPGGSRGGGPGSSPGGGAPAGQALRAVRPSSQRRAVACCPWCGYKF